MQSNAIPRILEYYFRNPYFTSQMKRAIREFFNGVLPQQADDVFDELDQNAMFNEWMVFDFKLDHGKTLLQDFYDRNPKNLPLKTLKIYQDLQDNRYSFFEILQVDIGRGLKLIDLCAGKKYYVREISATYQARKGNLFFGRIGRIGKHFELVGANPVSYGSSIRLSQNAREYFKNIKEKLNPKIVKDIILNGQESKQSETKLSLAQAEKELDSMLSRYKLKS